MKKEKGFTLVELVIVIVILGILGALIVPRFTKLETHARRSAVIGLEGAVRSAAAIAHSMALAEKQSGATGTIYMEGQAISLVYGYPSLTSIVDAVGGTNAIGDFSYAPGTGVFSLTGAPTPATCGVTYTAATASNPATITTNTAGCGTTS